MGEEVQGMYCVLRGKTKEKALSTEWTEGKHVVALRSPKNKTSMSSSLTSPITWNLLSPC